MVCLGNICRSPLAEGILRSKLDSDSYIIDSAGTGDWHVGNAPDDRSIKVGKENGVDISNLRGRQFTAQDLDDYDHLFVMDQNNYDDVIRKATAPDQKRKVRMMLDVLFPGERVDVPDPYQGDLSDFRKVYKMLDEACKELAEELG